jgi:hypothetical protein
MMAFVVLMNSTCVVTVVSLWAFSRANVQLDRANCAPLTSCRNARYRGPGFKHTSSLPPQKREEISKLMGHKHTEAPSYTQACSSLMRELLYFTDKRFKRLNCFFPTSSRCNYSDSYLILRALLAGCINAQGHGQSGGSPRWMLGHRICRSEFEDKNSGHPEVSAINRVKTISEKVWYTG